jgi:uncharacterized repeat protein (TIGR03803 family)
LTTLAMFDGFDDGANPSSTLVEGEDGGLYGTTTTGGPGGAGTIFRLSFTTAPQISAQPSSQTVIVGAKASFSVSVSAAPPRFYQWQKNGTNLTDAGNIGGSGGRILTLTNVNLTDSGSYSVIVSNALGFVVSSNALLNVVTQPVFQTIANHHGTVTFIWNSINGQKYQLQSIENLSSTNWINLGNAVAATNGAATGSDVMGADPQRFYRVIVSP